MADAGRALIAAANEAGGRDNITVILFRLEEVGRRGDSRVEQDTSEYATFAGDTFPEPRQGATRPYPQRGEGADAWRSDEAEAEYRRTGTMALPALRPSPAPRDEVAPVPPRTAPPRGEGARRRRRRGVRAGPIVALILAFCILAGGWLATRAVYFVGTDPADGRTITIFRGLPYDLPLGIRLYERYAGSGVTVEEIPSSRRATFTDHKLRSRDDAENLVIALERGQLSR